MTAFSADGLRRQVVPVAEAGHADDRVIRRM